MPKHSPGNWHLDDGPRPRFVLADRPEGNDFVVIAHLVPMVGDYSVDSANEVTAEFNGLLMAAAPDLLEALQSFGVLACTPEWQARKDAAIAKATTLSRSE